MAEQRSIAYKPLGFKLGLGGGPGLGLASSGTAASALLNTLLSSVPSAKTLLPTLVPELAKPKATVETGSGGQRQEGLHPAVPKEPEVAAVPPAESEKALSPKQSAKEEKETVPTQEQNASGQEPSAAAVEAGPEVIDLLSDSDSEPTAAAGPSAPKAPAAADDASTAAAPPAFVEFIPLPKTAPNKATPAPGSAKGAAPGSADALADEENIRRLGQRPYWMSYVSRIDSPMLRLHQELVELCELVQPTPEEAEARRSAVAAVTEVVRTIWPDARCEIFGSYATGLYVPTSDIDLVILDSGCTNVQAGLKALATSLAKRQVAQSIQVIGKARVPIVKFETVDFGSLAFDVSFDVANGPQAALLVSEMTSAWPMMRPLILCLKLFLQQRELNEVYTGGIGSYALITMVAAFLQLHASRRSKGSGGGGGAEGSSKRGRGNGAHPPQPMYGTAGAAAKASVSGAVEPGLGALLVDFFRFYGRVVNMPEVGVSCAGGGQFFRKTDKPTPAVPSHGFKGWVNKDRTFLLAVEDPKDPENDVCRNSFNIMRVKTAFEFAYQMLIAPVRRDESLLARILRLGPILASRPRPRVEHLRELGYYVQPPPEMRRDRSQRRSEAKEQRQQGAEGERREQQEEQGLEGEQRTEKEAEEEKEERGGAGGSGRETPARSTGSGKKRGRDNKKGESSATKGRQERKPEERKKNNRKDGREETPGRRGSTGPADSGKEGRSKKRGRGDVSPAAAPDGPAEDAPTRGTKRARTEGRQQQQQLQQQQQQQQQTGGGRSRDAGGSGSGQGRQQQQQQQQPPPHSHSHHQHHQHQTQHHQPQQQQGQHHRRPALMHVSTMPAPAQQPPVPAMPVAPIFHPGYAPPPAHNQRHGGDRERDRDRARGGNGGGRQQNSSNHAQQHHQGGGHHHHHHQRGGDDRGGGYQDGGYGQGQGRQRAPILVPQQQQQQQLRGHPHHHPQRTHVFFD